MVSLIFFHQHGYFNKKIIVYLDRLTYFSKNFKNYYSDNTFLRKKMS